MELLWEEEKQVASMFRDAVQENDIPSQVRQLQKLANVYKRCFSIDKNMNNLTKAAALCKAAQVRDKENEVGSEIEECLMMIETEMITHMKGACECVNTKEQTEENKRKLLDIRSWATEGCHGIMEQNWNIQEGESERTRLEREHKFVQETKDIFKNIAAKCRRFVQDLIGQCFSMLGSPPCKYAVIGLGSLAREENTPWSDLEFAILLEDENHKEYFRNLTYYLHLKVINLGETHLPSMAIKSLNDFSEGGESWFFDDITPSGFKFDGAMPWASKLPTGRPATSNKPALELICSPANLAALQAPAQAKLHGYHTADMLMSVCLIDGQQSLLDEYLERANVYLNEKASETNIDKYVNFRKVLSKAMALLMEKAGPDLQEKHRRFVESLRFDIGKYLAFQWHKLQCQISAKKDIYRIPSAMIDNFRVLHQGQIGNSWSLADKYFEEDARHNLQVMLSISVMIRLWVYSIQGAQVENLTTMVSKHITAGPLERGQPLCMKCPAMIVRYYQTLVPMCDFLCSSFDIQREMVRVFYNNTPFLKCIVMINSDLNAEGLGLAKHLLETDQIQFNIANVKKLKQLAMMLYFDGDTRGRGILQKALEIDSLPRQYAVELYAELGFSFLNPANGDYVKAANYTGLAYHLTKFGPPFNITRAYCLLQMGTCYIVAKNAKKSFEFLQKAQQTVDYIRQNPLEVSKDVSTFGNNWATGIEPEIIHLYPPEDEDSKRYWTQWLHDRDAPELEQLQCFIFYNLADMYELLQEYAKAVEFAKQALVLYEQLHGKNVSRPDRASFLYQVGRMLYMQGELGLALVYLDKAQKTIEELQSKNVFRGLDSQLEKRINDIKAKCVT